MAALRKDTTHARTRRGILAVAVKAGLSGNQSASTSTWTIIRKAGPLKRFAANTVAATLIAGVHAASISNIRITVYLQGNAAEVLRL